MKDFLDKNFADNIPVPIYIFDSNLKLLFANNSLLHTYGYTKKEILSNSIEKLYGDDSTWDTYRQMLKNSIDAGQGGQYYQQHRTKDGKLLNVNVVWSVIDMGRETYIINCVRDITEQRPAAQVELQTRNQEMLWEIEERQAIAEELKKIHVKLKKTTARLEGLSSIDHLTGLYNRVYLLSLFDEETKRVMELKGKIAVILTQIDYYQDYVEKFGVAVADQLTQYVAQIVLENLGRRDIAGRYSGDTFMIILPDKDLTQAESFIDEIQQQVQTIKSSTDKNQNIFITISAGITGNNFRVNRLKPEFAQRWMMQHVQSALVKAQRAGRNQKMVEHS